MAEAKTMYIMVAWIMIGYAVIVPASFIPDVSIRAVVIVAGQFSILPGLGAQRWLAKVHAAGFKIWRVTIRSPYPWKSKIGQWMFKVDPATTIEDATRFLPKSEQAKGWKRAKIVFARGYAIRHPVFNRGKETWFAYIDFQGDWRRRILQLEDKVISFGLVVPHTATDRVILWEREPDTRLCIPVIDIATQRQYPVFEMREASGDRQIVQDLRERRRDELLQMMGISR